jgi:hypothetical protein
MVSVMWWWGMYMWWTLTKNIGGNGVKNIEMAVSRHHHGKREETQGNAYKERTVCFADTCFVSWHADNVFWHVWHILWLRTRRLSMCALQALKVDLAWHFSDGCRLLQLRLGQESSHENQTKINMRVLGIGSWYNTSHIPFFLNLRPTKDFFTHKLCTMVG